MKLKLCDDLEIPPDAVSRTFGVLAVRGAGKSNTAAVMAEEMFAARLPFVVVDPVGSWYGLRSSADGTGPGLAIPIFGGKHGDIQIDRNAGDLLADLIVEKRLSCVLDLSRFASEADKKYFLLKFAQRLYEKNEDPLHLFLEEADDYIPQKPMRDEAYLLRAWENIVRRGRARGLGMTLITQRSAAINKMVLTQVETLIAMRTTGPQDIAAIEAWVKYHDVKGELLASLSSLPDGDAWVWSPQFLGITKRVHVRRRRTFDSGATPKNLGANQSRKAATLADVDLETIRTKMAETEARAKADDPKELRKRLNQVTLELSALKSKTVHMHAHAPAPAKPTREQIEERKSYVAENTRLQREVVQLRSILKKVGALVADHSAGLPATSSPAPVISNPAPTLPNRAPVERQARSTPRVIPEAAGELDGTARRALNTIAMLEIRGIDSNAESVARWMGIHPRGGRYTSALAALRSLGYLEGWSLTDSGRSIADPPKTGIPAVIDTIKEGTAKRSFEALLEAGRPTTTGDLAALLGIHPRGGRFTSGLAWLRQMGVISERSPMTVTEGARR